MFEHMSPTAWIFVLCGAWVSIVILCWWALAYWNDVGPVDHKTYNRIRGNRY